MPYGLLLAKVVELVCVGRRCALPLESQARLDVGGKTPASKPAHTYEVVSLWKEPVMTVITIKKSMRRLLRLVRRIIAGNAAE